MQDCAGGLTVEIVISPYGFVFPSSKDNTRLIQVAYREKMGLVMEQEKYGKVTA